MASNLACIGLAVADATELGHLVSAAHRSAHEVGVFDGIHVGRWQDNSGAVLILGWQSGDLLDLIPAYAAGSGGLLSGCHLINESVASAAVIDTDGEQLTAMTFDAQQYRQLKTLGRPASGPARITALGIAVQVHQDSDAFAASEDSLIDSSEDSLMGSSEDPAGEPPRHFLERGWSWPPRLASESFISHGLFAGPAQGTPRARMSGTVLTAERRVCALTGQPFTVASLRTAGFEADLCLAGSEHPSLPEPGNIISGTVYLSAALDTGAFDHDPGPLNS